MKEKLRVAVLAGGKSPEYEVSLISAREVVRNLNSQNYEILPVIISRDGTSFQLNNKKYSLSQLSTVNCQLFFIAMHGPYGEDGKVQGLLDFIGLPYTGSGVLASALGMDKIASRILFSQAGLKTPRYVIIEKDQKTNHILKNFTLPVFVKPEDQGSSVGVTKVCFQKDLPSALKKAWQYSKKAIVEEFIKGIEITGSILGNDKPKALPIVEIVPKKEFFDYEAKYTPAKSDEICPARISKSFTKKAQNAALLAYRTLGARGFGRVDMIVKGSDVYILEINTIPGLTPVSLFPKAAKAAGISYPALLDRIIKSALNP